MKMFLKKIKDKLNLPIILFITILINYVPLILPNMVSKESFGVSTKYMMISFIIEIFILILFLFKKVKIEKENKINIILLVVTTAIMCITQLVRFVVTKEKSFMDIINIGCIFINISLLIIPMLNMKCKEQYIFSFFKGIIYMALVACIVNVILYYREIAVTLGIIKTKEWVNIKSFFANRNQFAFFLYLSLIAEFFVMRKSNNLIYKILFPIFIVNLLLTMSRTGILVAIILFGLMFLFTDKISRRTKILIVVSLIAIAIMSLVIIKTNYTDLWKTLNRYFLRIEHIKDFGGRTDIWNVGIDILKESPLNFIFGVGRFQSTKLLEIDGKVFTQFHNIYLDLVLTSGIVGLLYFVFIYFTVIKKVLKSNLDKKFKNLYLIMYITYGIYIMFESFGRFSIGSSDTLCLIFFLTIPLLHANSIKVSEIQKKDDTEEIKGENENEE